MCAVPRRDLAYRSFIGTYQFATRSEAEVFLPHELSRISRSRKDNYRGSSLGLLLEVASSEQNTPMRRIALLEALEISQSILSRQRSRATAWCPSFYLACGGPYSWDSPIRGNGATAR